MLDTNFYKRLITPIIIAILLVALVFLGFYPNVSMILGGIALFLIGMEYMESGFRTFSGGMLEQVLEKFTNTTPKAITTGFVATSIVQSSSLLSVIVISFLTAELITLASAVGIIFGSNIGSTTTAWLVSMFGLKIKISAYAMPMIVMGILIPIVLKDKAWKGIASILIGLGVIFLGIGYMKDGFEVLKEGMNLASYAMDGYLGVFVYVLVGAVATIIIQSSSATMAIIITALATGQIEYANALALAIGANLGTTVTAVIGALKSNENGKRLALAHFIFNMITGAIAIIFIYQLTDLVDFISSLIGIGVENYAMKLALFHTIFNVVGVLIVSPFIKYLVTFLNKRFIPTSTEVGKAKYLDSSILAIPDVAMSAITKEVQHLFANGFKIIIHGINVKKKNLASDMDTKQVIQDAYSSEYIDIDAFYRYKIKGIYGQIIDFATRAQGNMNTEENSHNIEYLYKLKVAARDIVEAVKDTKHLQKNLIKYSKSKNTYVKEQYNQLREDLVVLLRDINSLATVKEQHEVVLILSKAKLHSQRYDMMANGRLDNLIRENLITAEMATSLMNDSTYAYDISKNLIDMAEVIFVDTNLANNILVDDEDIDDLLSNN
ncbi:MAG: Na/Pi cotransporter family protein [Arcobacteraceae bacterium]|nr:Na/Pi cotransporter family protein [Arcobacteraceae bacterium]